MLFGENLNRICKAKGTTPTAVCKELGLSTSKVSAWNNGSIPKEEIMLMLAKRLECSVMDFFADKEDLAADIPADEDEADILRVFRTLSRKGKHEFMAMVYEYENREELEGDKDNSSAV